jgi:hypothetical protein
MTAKPLGRHVLRAQRWHCSSLRHPHSRRYPTVCGPGDRERVVISVLLLRPYSVT